MIRIYLLSLVLLVCGCSTISTQVSKSQALAGSVFMDEPIPKVYGGIRMDFKMTKDIFVGSDSEDSPDAGQGSLFGLIYVLLDFPFSLLGDTLLLPMSLSSNAE